jgi:hypothetical protein
MIDAALSQNTSSRVDVSTPNGPDNPFANKWFGGHINKFDFHWTQDPRKDKEWYDKEVIRLSDPRVVAQELDLDFDTSGEESVVRQEWVTSSQAMYRHLKEEGVFPSRPPGVAGCDVGGGMAENTYIGLWGPEVGKCVAWVDDDTTATAYRFAHLASENGAQTIKFDSIGVGKGVASTLRRLPVQAQAVNVGSSPTRDVWPDGKKSRAKFRNLKAELWWILRDRLRKTHDHWLYMNGRGGYEYQLNELLLLPEDKDLTKQICIPGFKVLETGKIQIESKDELRRRGVPSPDRAEALILALAPAPAVVRSGRTSGVI